MEGMKMTDKLGCEVVRGREVSGDLHMVGHYKFFHHRGGKLLALRENHNVVTSEGKQHILSSALDNGTRKTAWYVALVTGDGPPPAPSASHVYATFFNSVVVEFQDYSSGSGNTERKLYDGVVSADKITNVAARASFTITTTTKAVHGAALVSHITKGNHAAGDILMSWADLTGGEIAVQINDVLNIEIELSFTA